MNDMKLITVLDNYKNHNSEISIAALKALGNHMWYLTEELVPLALFDRGLDDEVRSKIAESIVQCEDQGKGVKRRGTGFGKPEFPKVDIKKTEIASFVGPDSWTFFRTLEIDSAFLKMPVEDWEEEPSYKNGKSVVSHLCVVNDAAERGVKLCFDFLNAAKLEDGLQNVLQVVENCRSRLPNQRKRKLESKRWFLKLL